MEEPEIPMRPAWDIFKADTAGQFIPLSRFHSSAEAENYRDFLAGSNPGVHFEIRKSLAVVPDRSLPDRRQMEELGRLIQHVFVLIRSHARLSGSEVIEDIADVFHNMPTDMTDGERWDWNSLELSLRELAVRHPDGMLKGMSRRLREIRENRATTVS